jgi:hypothetical protein
MRRCGAVAAAARRPGHQARQPPADARYEQVVAAGRQDGGGSQAGCHRPSLELASRPDLNALGLSVDEQLAALVHGSSAAVQRLLHLVDAGD